MRIRAYSDLHLEFASFEPPASDGIDVVILAGDIDVKCRGVAFARRFPCPVVYVPGNHEYYGGAIPHVTEKLKLAAAGSNVHVLDNDSVVIGGTRFLGTSLWTDWSGDGTLDPSVAMEHARAGMSDYRRIRVSPRFGRLRPEDTLRWHARARSWLTRELDQPHQGPTVVVTHHAPTLRGCKPEDASTPFLGAYASNLEALMGPNVHTWVFGHTHFRFDERIHGTRVVSNPRGYAGDWVDGFRPDFALEVAR
ncbi:MAG: metallophosphoesterase family protein [Archangiaceae bacterium]|nr:metallophosphoesterase family protein [Archangiaceae bacterium]